MATMSHNGVGMRALDIITNQGCSNNIRNSVAGIVSFTHMHSLLVCLDIGCRVDYEIGSVEPAVYQLF